MHMQEVLVLEFIALVRLHQESGHFLNLHSLFGKMFSGSPTSQKDSIKKPCAKPTLSAL
jgi:hypothetical protein